MSTLTPDDPRYQELYDLAVRIGLAWREMRRGASYAKVRDWLYGTGDGSIEQGQMDTLDALASRPSWRMSELADELRVDPSTITRAIQRLERAGLAERRQSTDDGRVVEVVATELGLEKHAEVSHRRAVMMTSILSHYRTRELPVLADLLERFVAATEEFVGTEPEPDGVAAGS